MAKFKKNRMIPGRIFAILIVVLALALVQAGCGGPAKPKEGSVRLAVTTELGDSGLLDALLPEFTYDTGWTVEVTALDPESALSLGETGETDVLIVNAPDLEREFVEEGHSTKRTDLMFNVVKAHGKTLINQYGILALDTGEHDGVNALGARDLKNWIAGAKGQSMIGKFGKEEKGEALFVPNAPVRLRGPT